jgi:hypothetical protein
MYRKVEVKCTFVQALRLCTDRTARRRSRGIALLFHDHGTRRGEGSASRPGRSLPPRKTRYPLYRRWAPGPVWTGAEKLVPTGIRSPDRPARSQSLYRLRYHNIRTICAEKWHWAGFFPSNAVPYRQASFHQAPGAGTIGNSADSLRLITVTTLIELLRTDVLNQPISGPQSSIKTTKHK